MTAVLDTSFLVALTNTKDRNHSRVLNIARTISDPLILPLSILPEVCYLIGLEKNARQGRSCPCVYTPRT